MSAGQFKHFFKIVFRLVLKYPSLIFPAEKNNSYLVSHLITVSSEGPAEQ